VGGKSNIACSNKKTVAFVGVSNLCVVETDDELLVVAQDQVESVRQVLASIKGEPVSSQPVASDASVPPPAKPRAKRVAKTDVITPVIESVQEQVEEVHEVPMEKVVDQQDVA
jgi:hypothetical protein